MNVLYISQYLDKKYFDNLFNKSIEKPLQSIQKFNNLFVEGMNNNIDIKKIDILSTAPVNRNVSKKYFWKGKKVTVNKATFRYVPFINIKIFKHVFLFLLSIFYLLHWCIHNNSKKAVVIIDGFFPIISSNASLICKLFGFNVVLLYTDLPKCMNHNLKTESFVKKIAKFVVNINDIINVKCADMFWLLTEEMNNVVNKKNKPYIVVEGFVDSKLDTSLCKRKLNAFMYAGGLYEKYGVKLLIDSFAKWGNNNYELWLCGNGDLIDYINSLANSNIKYLGCLPNEKVVELEKECKLLINPRFSNEEYTKYSYPSKNMEYMVSGTPVLTTNLLGMPSEYKDKVFIIENETLDGYMEKFEFISMITDNEMKENGKNTQKFMLSNKNNIVQINKLFEFIKANMKYEKNIRKSIALVFLIFNLFIVLFSATNPIGLFNVNQRTYFLYLLSVFLTTLFILVPISKQHKHYTSQEFLTTKSFKVLEIICLFIVSFYLIKYNMIIKDLNINEVRLAAFTLLFDNAFENLFFTYIISNLVTFFLILIPIIVFDKTINIHENKFNLIIMIIIVILYNFIGFSRLNMLIFGISLIFSFYIFDGKINAKKIARFVIFIMILFFVSALMLNFRIYGFSGGLDSLYISIKAQSQQIIEYFLGSFRMLNRFLSNGFTEFDNFTLGRATFAGFDEIITYPKKYFDDNLLSFNNIIGELTQKGYAVGVKTPYYNAFYTSIMNFYLDLGVMGIILFSIIHGLFISFIVDNFSLKKSVISKILLIFVFTNLMLTIFKWPYQAGCVVFFILTLLILDTIFIRKRGIV